jgi:hypothetical protein
MMNTSIGSRDTRSTISRPVTGALLALAAIAFAAPAGATPTHASASAPWVPDVLEGGDPYQPDPDFAGGTFGFDHFAGSNANDYIGIKSVRLDDGTIVTGGLVPSWTGGNPSNGLWNLGLVHYAADGTRLAWTNPGQYGFFANNYVVYPNLDAPFYQYFRDMVVLNGFIYVLVDDPASSQTGLGRQDSRIVVFRLDGSYHSQYPVFGAADDPAEDTVDFYGGRIVPINSTRVIVTATAYDSVGGYLAVDRLGILSNGALDLDTSWGEGYGGPNSFSRLINYFPPDYFCANAPCTMDAYYAMKPDDNGFEDFYVAGSKQYDGDDWDVYVAKISSQDGTLKTEFGGDGWATANFDQPSSDFEDHVAGLYVRGDADIYVAAAVAQKCHPGVGVAKLDGTGSLNASFGTNGKVVFGGQGDAPFCFAGVQDDVPTDMARNGTRLGIVGYHANNLGIGGPTTYDPMFAAVSTTNGALVSFGAYPLLRNDGTRRGDSILYSVFGGFANDEARFTVGGNGRDTTMGNTLGYVTGRMMPASFDRIFADGFEP